MSLLEDVREERNIPPRVSLVLIMLLTIMVTAVSLTQFWRSDTKDLVRVLQQTGQTSVDATGAADSITDDNRLEESELLFIVEEARQTREGLAPESDFGGSELDGNPLGL